MNENDRFQHSTPELYDRYMGPLLFEPYAKFIAERAALLRAARILETAAGTGIVTQALQRCVPEARIIATDLNPAMLNVAADHIRSDRVSLKTAYAQELPFGDDSFDLVVCQFGIMFFPDKVRANREARRVLSPGGHYLLVSFDSLEHNAVPHAAGDAVDALFPEHPLRYMERGPFSYADPAVIKDDLLAAGFTDITLETIALPTRVSSQDAARGIVLGSPFRAEIAERDPSALERALKAVTEALAKWDGREALLSAHVVTATNGT
jgi:ubiquinone/menaquinone biosynthesis C-methylase UbiE